MAQNGWEWALQQGWLWPDKEGGGFTWKKVDVRKNIFTMSVWNSGTGSPEKLPHLQKCSRPGWLELEQPGLVEPVHGWGLEWDYLECPFQPKLF